MKRIMRAGYFRGKPITGRQVTGEFDGFTSVNKTVCAAVTELGLSLPKGFRAAAAWFGRGGNVTRQRQAKEKQVFRRAGAT